MSFCVVSQWLIAWRGVEHACEQFDEILMKQKITIVVLKSYKDIRIVYQECHRQATDGSNCGQVLIKQNFEVK